MSASFIAATRTRARIADAVQQRARLSVVRRPNPAPRVPFAALVLTVLGLGLVGLLVLNTSLQQGAFYARGLEAKAEALTETREALSMQVAQLREPQRVAARAAAMGMVQGESPAFLRLSDGKVLGRTQPATTESGVDFLTAPRAAHASSAAAGSTGGATAQARDGSSR